jgi:hypothetical protein
MQPASNGVVFWGKSKFANSDERCCTPEYDVFCERNGFIFDIEFLCDVIFPVLVMTISRYLDAEMTIVNQI